MGLTRPLPGEYAEAYAPYLAEAGDGDVRTLLQGQMGEVTALFAGLSETQGGFRYAPGKWSLKDLLQHLSDAERDRKSTRLNSSHYGLSRMPSSA